MDEESVDDDRDELRSGWVQKLRKTHFHTKVVGGGRTVAPPPKYATDVDYNTVHL